MLTGATRREHDSAEIGLAVRFVCGPMRSAIVVSAPAAGQRIWPPCPDFRAHVAQGSRRHPVLRARAEARVDVGE
jgi:hypothetical protein